MTLRGRNQPAAVTHFRSAAIDLRYCIAGLDGFVSPAHPLWLTPLPARPRPFADGGPETTPVTYADYFEAVRAYLDGPGQSHLARVMGYRSPRAAGSPECVTVILEKHGEFYHPARLALENQGERVALVLNVAVTPAGNAWMSSEVEALAAVAERLPPGCLPIVYGHATVTMGERPVSMFLADWFAGFNEFHLSRDPLSGRQRTVVWDTRRGPFFLSDRQQRLVHRKAAYLLARAYDPATSRQIYPWHHASGDFVLRTEGDSIELRLITVRQYAPTLEGGGGVLDDQERLMALLVFFLNLTLRNRLDRLDGTGETAWADPEAVTATVAGVCEALEPEEASALKSLLRTYSAAELTTVLEAVAERYRLMPMEENILRTHLAPHAEHLHRILGRV